MIIINPTFNNTSTLSRQSILLIKGTGLPLLNGNLRPKMLQIPIDAKLHNVDVPNRKTPTFHWIM
jgi:hypothetical protein